MSTCLQHPRLHCAHKEGLPMLNLDKKFQLSPKDLLVLYLPENSRLQLFLLIEFTLRARNENILHTSCCGTLDEHTHLHSYLTKDLALRLFFQGAREEVITEIVTSLKMMLWAFHQILKMPIFQHMCLFLPISSAGGNSDCRPSSVYLSILPPTPSLHLSSPCLLSLG